MGSVVVAHGLSSCGTWALVAHAMWNLPRPGIKPMSPALAGGFPSSVPPGKLSFKYCYPPSSWTQFQTQLGFKNQTKNQAITELLLLRSKAGVEATNAASQYSHFPSFRWVGRLDFPGFWGWMSHVIFLCLIMWLEEVQAASGCQCLRVNWGSPCSGLLFYSGHVSRMCHGVQQQEQLPGRCQNWQYTLNNWAISHCFKLLRCLRLSVTTVETSITWWIQKETDSNIYWIGNITLLRKGGKKPCPDNPNSWVKYFDFFLFLLPLQLEGVGEVLKSR